MTSEQVQGPLGFSHKRRNIYLMLTNLIIARAMSNTGSALSFDGARYLSHI